VKIMSCISDLTRYSRTISWCCQVQGVL
jgi:hypothetical protein